MQVLKQAIKSGIVPAIEIKLNYIPIFQQYGAPPHIYDPVR